MAALLGQGPFYKVGVSRALEATFGAERIILIVFGKYFPRKLTENHGRVAKELGPGTQPIGSGWLRLAPRKRRGKCGPGPPFHVHRGSG